MWERYQEAKKVQTQQSEDKGKAEAFVLRAARKLVERVYCWDCNAAKLLKLRRRGTVEKEDAKLIRVVAF